MVGFHGDCVVVGRFELFEAPTNFTFYFLFFSFPNDFGLDFFESQWIDKDSPAIMTNKLHSLYGDDPLHDPFVSLHNTFARRLYGVEWSGV